jgi:hypothetical protein
MAWWKQQSELTELASFDLVWGPASADDPSLTNLHVITLTI